MNALSKCLLNDNEFLGKYNNQSMRSLIISNLNSIHMEVSEYRESQYPYMPCFWAKMKDNKKVDIYLNHNFCRNRRVNYENSI